MCHEQRERRQSRGFTLVEIIVATAVFSLFLGGLFSLYRMGSKMFVAGSWKLQKQKEAERFLALLKERLDQASHAATISAPPTSQLTENFSQIGYVASLTRPTLGDNSRRVLLFVVCKPSIAASAGVILYHGLQAKPTPGQPDLFNLEFVSTTNVNHPLLAGTAFPFFTTDPDVTLFNQVGGATPAAFRLGADPLQLDLTELAAMRISNSGVASETLFRVQFDFKHPNETSHDKTKVSHQIVSRIEVPAVEFTLGAL